MRFMGATTKSCSVGMGILALVAVTVISKGLAAKDDGKNCAAYAGSFVSDTGEPCSSPIGLCTHGLLGGEFPATYDFTFQSLQPANDPSDPTKFVYTGTSVVGATGGGGVMYTEDSGIIHIPADGSPAPFITKAIVSRGTGKYRHTEGGFVASGSLTFQTGHAIGEYAAVLCSNGRH